MHLPAPPPIATGAAAVPRDQPRWVPGAGTPPGFRAAATRAGEQLSALLCTAPQQAFCVVQLDCNAAGAVRSLRVLQAERPFAPPEPLQDPDERGAPDALGARFTSTLMTRLAVARTSSHGARFTIATERQSFEVWACPLAGTPDTLAVVFEAAHRVEQRDADHADDAIATIARLQHEGTLRNRFMAMVAHELRNTTQTLTSALELVGWGAKDAQLLARSVAIAQRQLQHMTRLVGDLVEVGRLVTDQLELQSSRQCLQSLVAQAVDACRPGAETRGHTLIVESTDEPLWVMADPVRCTQVLINLLHNATKFTQPGGRLVVALRRDGQHAQLEVRDNGVGVAAADLDHIFDLFRREPSSKGLSNGGLGIGLALVRRLVELHGGTVQASSRGRDKGATFTVRLPLIPEDPALSGAVNPA